MCGLFQREGVLAKWLARWTSDLEVWVLALAGGTGLCSSAKHFTLRPRPHVFGYFFLSEFAFRIQKFSCPHFPDAASVWRIRQEIPIVSFSLTRMEKTEPQRIRQGVDG